MSALEDMRLFVQTVDAGGFTAAAARLGLSKQLVSRRLIALEARLGARLLIRTTRSLRPTAQGLAYYEDAQRILDEVEALEQAIRRDSTAPRGRLRLSAPMSFGTLRLSPALPRFLAAHPGLTVELELSDRVVDLVGEGYDAAVRIGTLPDSTLIAPCVAAMELLTCASPDYLARHGTPAAPAALRAHACLLYGHGPRSAWRYREAGRLRTIAVRGTLCANNGELLCDAACAGLGLVQLPEFIVAEALAGGRLVVVLDAYRPPALGVHVVYARHRQASPAVQAFCEFLRGTFAMPAPAVAGAP